MSNSNNNLSICWQNDMYLLLLFKQPSCFNTYITAVNSFKHSLHTGLLPYRLYSFYHLPGYYKINFFEV